MERNLERKTLSFDKGVTNVPSDLLSDDSELLESDGFIFKDGEMKAVQKGVEITGGVPLEGKLVYVHKLADYRNLITYIENGTKLKCYIDFKDNQSTDRKTQTIELGSKLLDIKHVGNTLVCATEEGLHYILCKGHQYNDLGTELPIPKVEFYTDGTTDHWQEKQDDLKKDSFMCNLEEIVDLNKRYAFYSMSGDDIHKLYATDSDPNKYNSVDAVMYWSHAIKQDRETDFKNAVVGHIGQMRNWVKEKNKFAYPFFVRFALKMFDGSYARISNPIICYPSISLNCKFVGMGMSSLGYYKEDLGAKMYLYHIGYSGLFFKASIDNKDNWGDIVKELVVFATDDVIPFELNEDWKFKDPMDVDNTVFYNGGGSYHESMVSFRDSTFRGDGYHPLASEWLMPVYKTEAKIIEELLDKTQFYKLFSLRMDSQYLDGKWHDSSYRDESVSDVNIIANGVVSNLTEQEQLKVDDYYGWTKLVSEKLFTYNNRINTIGLKRYPFNGFNFFTECKEKSKLSYEYYVHIVNQQIDTWVKSEPNNNVDAIVFSGWLYYPDPNAQEMIIMQQGERWGLRVTLNQHKLLNGSYSFANLPGMGGNIKFSTMDAPTVSGGFEDLNSQIFTSVVNNPFVFEASGDNTVGTGKILGIIANTEAVSQGQFGQYPLMVFTDEGIYGLSVNSEGLYSRAYPISREVCNEDSPLVPTDRLVFFAAKKGLMAASGGSVACMSEQMRGRVPRNFATFGEGKFLDFLKGCLIAYDYRDSILRIFSKGKSYQYIYNMVDKTFSMVNSGIEAQSVVNDYPDNLIQDTNGNVYSLTAKPDINEDTENYSGSFTTRPLKLGGSMTLKSLRAVKHLFDSDEGTIGLEIYGSNDCKHWCKLPSVGGKPWKYFTFKYTLQNFKAADAFAGSIVEVQSRREDKMR